MLIILMFVAWLLVDPLCFVVYHLRISCCLCAVTFQSHASSCRIELVAQRQYPASFMFSRSNMLWFALVLGVGVISARLGLANGLDDPVASQMLYLGLDRDCSGNRLLLVLRSLFWVLVQLSVTFIRPSHV